MFNRVEDLDKYIREARVRGVSDEMIRVELLKASWPEDKVNQALKGKNVMSAGGVVEDVYPRFSLSLIQNPSKVYNFPFFGLLIKQLMLIPVFFVYGFYVFYVMMLVFLVNPWVVLFTGHYWKYAFDKGVSMMRLGGKISMFFYGLTNKYPGFNSKLEEGVVYEIDYPERTNRLLTAPLLGMIIRQFLLIPMMVFQMALMYGVVIGMVGVSFVVLFRGRYPESVFEMARDSVRGMSGMSMYLMGMSDKYPSFKISWNHKMVKIVLMMLGGLWWLSMTYSTNFSVFLPNPGITIFSDVDLDEFDKIDQSQLNTTPSQITVSSEEDIMNHPDIVRYSVDSDGDVIPDFIEVERGLNPDVAVADECSRSSCDDPDIENSSKKGANVLIILDASGSMAAKVSGITKIQAAKEAVSKYIDSLDFDNLKVALMVYGHKGSNSVADKAYSCSQIEVLYSLGLTDKQTMKTAVASFDAKGWTPIQGALDMAPSVFVGHEGENNHIILVSDGWEQCGGQPVEAAKRLKDSAFKLTVNVIGFDVKTSEQAQLKAIAESTGGSFVNTTTAGDLLNELLAKGASARNLTNYTICRGQANSRYAMCLMKTYQSVTNWLAGGGPKRILSGGRYDDSELTKREREIILDLYHKINDYMKKLYSEAEQKMRDDLNEDTQRIKDSL
jgi:hypothetical protein